MARLLNRLARMGSGNQQSYVPLSKQLEVDVGGIARRLLWYPYSLGTIYLDQPDHHEPFEKPGVHLFWVVSGRGTLKTQECDYSLRPGNVVWFVDMMQSRTYTPRPGKRLTIRGIRFGGPHLRNWHAALGGREQAEFVLKDTAAVRQAYRDVWHAVQHRRIGWEWKVHLLLDQILGLLLASRNYFPPQSLELPVPVACVLNTVAADPLRNWKAKELARIARVSYSGLRALFRSTQHETIHQFVQRKRLEQARVLLSDVSLTIKQVAERMHFTSEFYFSHFFKRGDGRTPSGFREELKSPKRVPTS